MNQEILPKENILLNVTIESKEEAIRKAGEVLVKGGYVDAGYIEKMLEREELTSTYMGNGIAIPHGTEDAKKNVRKSGISILQVPNGVDFGNGNVVKVVFGIAGKDNEHLDLLSKIAITCSDESNIQRILDASTEEDLLAIFKEED
ncbi:PTS system mannitol-specific IIA component [Evansella vedderi]|uniref:Mannitol-specific phosphotransferase enzyme IIA component n=1 Tax=Evansella vedderi TaxID=38282 RepID=A0ABT9ZNZ3_9BACI|nr:PTS sugar transporter subunit IIA [Evansella vedderi]MDQ0252963.1 PTS system mannitol-specific IIA component [Evansella vedderi]